MWPVGTVPDPIYPPPCIVNYYGVVSDDTKKLIVFLFDAISIEVSVEELARGTGLTVADVLLAADPALVDTVEWSSSAPAIRLSLTAPGRRAARALCSSQRSGPKR